MSGEYDRSRPRPSRSAFFDESDAPPRRGGKKAKPPPGIITAGGVDMARAHATGIKIRDGVAAENSLDEPRVVVAVETDPRKVPTHRSLLDGRDAEEEGARAALLPAGNEPSPWAAPTATADEAIDKSALPSATRGPSPSSIDPDAETLKRRRSQFPVWMHVAAVLVLILLLAGLVRRVRLATSVPPEPAVPLKVPPAPSPVEATPPLTLTAPSPAPTAGKPRRTAEPSPPAASAEPEARARAARPAPPPPKPTYLPPFQLPGEKN